MCDDSVAFLSKQTTFHTTTFFFFFLVLGCWFSSLVPSCSRSSFASLWKWYGPRTEWWVWTPILGHNFSKTFAFSLSDLSKATARIQERKKSSTRKFFFFFFRLKCQWDITLVKNRVEKIAKAKGISMAQLSLAWVMSRKGIFFFSFLLLLSFPPSKKKKKKIQGVSAPVIGSTSLENLYDLLGMRFYFNSLFWLRGGNLFFFFFSNRCCQC